MKNTKLLFAIGQGSLALALMIHHYLAKNMVIFALIGLFTALSIVANVALMVIKIKEIKSRKQQ